ncbi:HD domain-containing protein [Acetobacteraceae bacterium H6797]|nr:HD domain-containing protein [Acetobacteraceae bacterium H6797]
MDPARARQLIAFFAFADRLKHVERRGRTISPDGRARQENAAEHGWHLALFALMLRHDIAEKVDLARVFSMLAVHDLVEIEAGDTFAYDLVHAESQGAREALAAANIIAMLPGDLAADFSSLWHEFEAGETPEARFAMGCDRAQGFFQQVISGAEAWKAAGITRAQSLRRMQPAIDAGPAFATLINELYDMAEADGLFRADTLPAAG